MTRKEWPSAMAVHLLRFHHQTSRSPPLFQCPPIVRGIRMHRQILQMTVTRMLVTLIPNVQEKSNTVLQ